METGDNIALRDRFTNIGVFGVYYLMLVAYLVASFIPGDGVWWFNCWAYYPDWVRWGLFGWGVMVPVVLRFVPTNEIDDPDR